MKPAYAIIILACLLVSASRRDSFDIAVLKVNEKNIRLKLNKFKEGGVELSLDMKNHTPNDLVNSAKKYIGYPHCMGGDGINKKTSGGKKCIDCSGLLFAVFRDLEIEVKVHGSQEMARYGKIILEKAELKKGDMIFFIKSYKPSDPDIVITHSGFVLDSARWIHTSATRGVIIDNLDYKWWNDKFLYGTRLFAESQWEDKNSKSEKTNSEPEEDYAEPEDMNYDNRGF